MDTPRSCSASGTGLSCVTETVSYDAIMDAIFLASARIRVAANIRR